MIFGKKKKEIPFLYELKESLVTDTEMEYLECIESILPEGYLVLPQANLAAFITRTDQARYRGELFRNIDFIVTDLDYCPVLWTVKKYGSQSWKKKDFGFGWQKNVRNRSAF